MNIYEKRKEVELAYPKRHTSTRYFNRGDDKYYFVYTSTCRNTMFNVFGEYGIWDGKICPKCGRTLKVIEPCDEEYDENIGISPRCRG